MLTLSLEILILIQGDDCNYRALFRRYRDVEAKSRVL